MRPRPIGMLNHKTSRTVLATAALGAVLVTGACASGGTDSDRSAPASAVEEEAAGAPDEGRDDSADRMNNSLVEGDAAADPGASPEQTKQKEPQEQAIISTGTISLEAGDVTKARFEVQKVVDTYSGSVSQEETSTGDDGKLETARMVLRVPSERFADATADLEDVATLTSSSYGSEDVTTEVIDVEARIRAQEKSVSRIEALLAEAENLRTLMTIERELARRQAELDSLKSQQKYLADRTSLATITVYVERVGPDQEDTDRAGFLGGLANGWDSFVAALSGTLTVLGFLLPWLALFGLLGGVIWVALRLARRRRRTPAVAADA